jgi:hypothetical protein
MKLEKQTLPQNRSWSMPTVIGATVIATTAVFAAGAITGVRWMTSDGRSAVECPETVEPTEQHFALPPPPQSVRMNWNWMVDASLPQRAHWATTLVDASSEYSPNSWSARQVLGAPNVFPAYGDHVNAWASSSADSYTEQLEVGFGQPQKLRGVHIVETFNPFAVEKIEGIALDGSRVTLFSNDGNIDQKRPSDTSVVQHMTGACTPMEIASIRVTINSKAVAGWNEIDAIAVDTCDSGQVQPHK